MSLRRVAQNVGILAAGILAGCLLLELGTVLLLGEQPKFPRHVVGSSFGLRINEPGSVYRHKSADVSVEFRINREGMRASRDYPYQKPTGVSRVVSLGDSFTIGYEVSVNETFSAVLEQELLKHGYRAEVLNAGVSGYSTAEECLYLEKELFRYQPDIILVSFYGNDLLDNLRTGLFALHGDRLELIKDRYVPLGRLGNFLNTNPLVGFLSERSNAFALLKERLTLLVKLDWFRARGETSGFPNGKEREHAQKLTAAIFERIYEWARHAHVPLIIQTIPFIIKEPPSMEDVFPYRYFDANREGLFLLRAEEVLKPFLGKEQLLWERSHGHWTPFSHRQSGKALADLITRHALLPSP